MARDYYILLGIERYADAGQIKHAYRRIAKRFHPDRSASSADAERFMEAKEAYETLTDAERRRRYDDELNSRESSLRIRRVPEIVRDRSQLYSEWAQRESVVDEFFEGWVPGFYTSTRRRGFEKNLYLEVILCPREARAGGLFPISFSVAEACPQCHRTGMLAQFFCPVCRGRGGVSTEREFSLSIPPRTADGTVVSLSLEDIGLKDVRLHVAVRVDPQLED
jgi:molecular chaperone DnaJ